MTVLDDFDRVGDLLGEVCETAGSLPMQTGETGGDRIVGAASAATTAAGVGDVSRAVAVSWPEIVGAEVAMNATPVRLKAGRLTVSTSSSLWAHTLQYMGDDLAARLNEHLGAEVVQQIVFRHAGWEEGPHRGTAVFSGRQVPPPTHVAPGEFSAEQEAALAEVEGLDLPPAIREKVTCAMKVSFVRAQHGSVR